MHMKTSKHLTIRNVPEELHRALNEEKERLGRSLNQTVIDLLRQRLGVVSIPSNGLARFAGAWSATEFEEFEANTRLFEAIDSDIWQ
jgi:plasmid stability protein